MSKDNNRPYFGADSHFPVTGDSILFVTLRSDMQNYAILVTYYFFLVKQAFTNALSVHEFPFFVGTSLNSYVCGLNDPADHPI